MRLRIGGAFEQQSRRGDVAERQQAFGACHQRCQRFGIERFRRRSGFIPCTCGRVSTPIQKSPMCRSKIPQPQGVISR